MKIRSFIALELAPEAHSILKNQLASWKAAYPSGINWVREENLHQTILFLGDIDPVIIPDLEQMLEDLARHQEPFQLQLKGYELFPDKAPRMIWAQLESPDNSPYKFNRLLLHAAKDLGLEPDDKALRLHITMGRIKAPQSPAVITEFLQTTCTTTMLTFGLLSLYQSVLQPDGPVYTLIKQIELS